MLSNFNKTDRLNKKAMDFLSPEVRIQIFVCLPVKTLIRCTCVCKSWQSFIEDPFFVDAHLQVQRRDLMLVRAMPKEDSSTKESYAIHCDDETFTIYEKLNFPLTYPQPGHCFRIIGNCNGVLCITTDQSGIMQHTYMWNPNIQKMVKLPFPRIVYESYGPFEHELGFGYDVKTNDYKVVRIVQLESDCFASSAQTLMVELYTLSSGIWRDISHLASDIVCRPYGRKPNAYVNGAAHWIAMSSRSRNGCIVVSFHFGEEVFRSFETPIGLSHNSYYYGVRPVVVQGSLCLFEQPKKRCIIWMMKEYGDSNSWTKWLDIKFHDSVQRLIGFRNKGELLLQIDGKLSSFDHEKAQGKGPNILRASHLRIWNLLQQGHGYPEDLFIPEEVYTYDPNAAPKDLGIESKVEYYMAPTLFCDGYVVSLALIGKSSVRHVADQDQ